MRSFALACALLCVAVPVAAQRASNAWVPIGSTTENYLRHLAAGDTLALAAVSWTARSPASLASLSAPVATDPWSGRLGDSGTSDRVLLLPARAILWFNTALPYGSMDGPVWAGRGVTVAATAGVAAHWKFVSIDLAPIAWLTQNRPFALPPNGETGRLSYADALNPTSVDRPRRFGDRSVQALDPGNSTLDLTWKSATAGLTTAAEAWGPAVRYPFLLGPNAAGVPRAFLGTSRPVSIGIGALSARLLYGRLEDSPYAFYDTIDTRNRFLSGLVVSLQPRVLSGLEFGIGRLFHTPLGDGSVAPRDLFKPFEGLFKRSLGDQDQTGSGEGDFDNQLLSVFARWVLPRNSAEVYLEMGREDHSYDLRDLLLEPDHTATRLIGFRKSWRRGARLYGVTAETFAAEATQAIIVRAEGKTYIGSILRQGHTHRGQLLGADVGPGHGAGQFLAFDRFGASDRWRLSLERRIRGRPEPLQDLGIPDPRLEVQLAFGLEWSRFHGPLELEIGAAAINYTRRDLVEDGQSFRVTMAVGWPADVK